MADILIYYKTHWYDLETPERQAELDIDRKFDIRYVMGDIIEIQDSPKLQNYRNPDFRVIEVTNRTGEQTRNYKICWQREFTANRTLNDIESGRFEYEITITQTSISGKELLQVAKEIIKNPDWLEIMSKSPTMVKVGFNGTVARRDKFEERAKHYLVVLSRIIAKSKYIVDVDNLPANIKNRLDNPESNNGWVISFEWSQLSPYILNKEVI